MADKKQSDEVVRLVSRVWKEYTDLVGRDLLRSLAEGRDNFRMTSGGAKFENAVVLEIVKLAVEFSLVAVHLASLALEIQERRDRTIQLRDDPKYSKLAERKKHEVIQSLHLLD